MSVLEHHARQDRPVLPAEDAELHLFFPLLVHRRVQRVKDVSVEAAYVTGLLAQVVVARGIFVGSLPLVEQALAA